MSSAIRPGMGALEWAMLVLLSLLWGGSFLFFAIAITGLPTFTIVALRVGIATLLLWLAALALGLDVPRSPARWRDFLLIGLVNNAVPFSLIVWAQHEIASGLAAILNATTPLFTVVIAHAMTSDERLTPGRVAGVTVGFAGVAMMLGFDLLRDLGSHVLAQAAVLAAALSYAYAAVFGRRFRDVPPLVTAAGQTTGSALLLVPLVLLVDRPWTLPMPGVEVWAAIAALAVLSTAFAYVLYFMILKRAGATNLLLVTFLVPVSAVALGIVVLGEAMQPGHLVGAAAIGIGLGLIDGRPLAAARRRLAVR